MVNLFPLCQVITSWAINQSYLKNLIRSSPNLQSFQSLFMERKEPGFFPKQITLAFMAVFVWLPISLDKKGTKSDLCKRKQQTTFLSPCFTDPGLKTMQLKVSTTKGTRLSDTSCRTDLFPSSI